MLTAEQQQLVKATVPVLREHGVDLIRYFYQRMLRFQPELQHIFNKDHQNSGQQARALAMAVLAYAENIDNLSVLLPAVTRIAHKHTSIGIRAEQYPIVGKHLIASIKEVLGEAATEPLVDAWIKAYQQLADILIQEERKLYVEAANEQGGWSGWRPFNVLRKEQESDEVTSFYFSPVEGGTIAQHKAGQYISLKIFIPEWQIEQIRQYTLSDAYNGEYYRISVKRESESTESFGKMSNLLHDAINEGDIISLSHPFGDFYLDEQGVNPIVFISAGVGQTPMIAMLNRIMALKSSRKVTYLHASRHGGTHFMGAWLKEVTNANDNIFADIYYENPRDQDHLGIDYDKSGRIDLTHYDHQWLPDNADYYLCGPKAFMLAQRDALLARGIPMAQIHYELFGSDVIG